MILVLIVFLVFTLTWAVVASVFLWRFARVILILENDFSEATETFRDAESRLDACLSMPLFFDSPEVQAVTMEALESVKLSKNAVAGMVRKFTQRSRQKYVEVVEGNDS